MILRLARTHALSVGAIFLTSSLMSLGAQATSTPRNLSASDIKSITKTHIIPAMHRPWTAHAVPNNEDLGFDLGIESAFMWRRDLLTLGDATGSVPSITPVPRIWLAFDLPEGFKVSGSWGPGDLFDGVQTYGLGVHWTFMQNDDVYYSAEVAYTYVNLFGDLRGNVMAASVEIAKDLVTWQPYAGVGLVVANSTALDGRASAGTDSGPYTVPQFHLFAGARVDLLAKLAIQLDILGTRPAVGVLIERAF